MDSSVAMSKVQAAVRRLVKDEPRFTGRFRAELHFRNGRVIRLKKVALRPVL